jgi:hypothetical protein
MNRECLEQPFDATQIKQRRGRTGTVLDYVEGHTVIARLNEAFAGAWSFEVPWHEIRETEVLVLGRLTAEGIVKTQFGASQVTRDRETKALVSLGDDLKAAATDALKKCATFLGVGLHLYADKPLRRPGAGGPPRPAGAAGRATPPGPPSAGGIEPPPPGGPTNGDGAGGKGVTPRQLDAIGRIGQAKGLAPAAVEALSLRVFQRPPAGLTTAEASALIKELAVLRRATA